MAQLECVRAIGESGLDFNRNYSSPSAQEFAFQQQMELAVTLNMPLFCHQRDAHKRFVVMKHKKYREGELVGNDLVLEAITPSGAVFRFRDTSFRIEL